MPEQGASDIVAWRAVPGDDPIRVLAGRGGLRGSGRWHSKGRLVVYLASTPSLAMLEVLANTTAENLLALDYHLMRVTLPAGGVDRLPQGDLPSGWNAPVRSTATMLLGDCWLDARVNLALQVPSALVPLDVEAAEHNFVLNPLHVLSAQVTQIHRLPFDPRLKSAGGTSASRP